ncbi:LWamide neuropeptides-like [Dreissena polymorpha]|uniref:Uncharacterized protein n=1 Tax=Dreissena polymorpha TaxID=45954 RepID=A0A9D4JM19_DREPO|nr:LWamide neuropeptides-like [Dreissena polymorpha]XP_052215060.1 LWamide neuropeptides-like [Dreissena polymorpha]KAH3815329.1 hypothetical protein DPMN_143851 [Dreissena polymorpha]
MYTRLLATHILTTLIISLSLGEEHKTNTDNGIDRVRRDLVEPNDGVSEETFDPDEDIDMEKKWSERPKYKTFDSLASSLIKRFGDGRSFDSLASGLIGKRYGDGRSFDTLASGLIGKRYGDGRSFDTLASGLIGKRYGDGRSFDTLASGLIGKRSDGRYGSSYFDSLASGLVGKRYDGRTFDQLASGLVGKRPWDEKRYRHFDSLASSLIGKRAYESSEEEEMMSKRAFYPRWRSGNIKRRPFDMLASSLIQ